MATVPTQGVAPYLARIRQARMAQMPQAGGGNLAAMLNQIRALRAAQPQSAASAAPVARPSVNQGGFPVQAPTGTPAGTATASAPVGPPVVPTPQNPGGPVAPQPGAPIPAAGPQAYIPPRRRAMMQPTEAQ